MIKFDCNVDTLKETLNTIILRVAANESPKCPRWIWHTNDRPDNSKATVDCNICAEFFPQIKTLRKGWCPCQCYTQQEVIDKLKEVLENNF